MKRALISVSDKTGIVAFAQGLVAADFEIISTGGTFSALEKAGVPVTPIDEVTHFPEMLDGRVKTSIPIFTVVYWLSVMNQHIWRHLLNTRLHRLILSVLTSIPLKKRFKNQRLPKRKRLNKLILVVHQCCVQLLKTLSQCTSWWIKPTMTKHWHNCNKMMSLTAAI